MTLGHNRGGTASKCGRPIYAKVDVEWADLDVFFRAIFWVLRPLHQRHNCSWVSLAELQDLVEELDHVRCREIRAPDHLQRELLRHRLLKVSDFVFLGTAWVNRPEKTGVLHMA